MAEKQKRSKSHYIQSKKRQKTQARGRVSLDTLKTSTQGIIATANFLDYGCRCEVFSLLDDFTAGKKVKPQKTDVNQDVDDEIAKEIAELKEEKKRFKIVDTTLNNMMFVSISDDSLEACHLVHSILSGLLEKKERKTRFLQRLIPVSHTCYASVEDIKKTALIMMKDLFYNKTTKTFGIIFKSRNNSSISRDEVIKVVATVATDGETYSEFNKVNLDNPEFAIVINVVKNITFMGVLKDFKLLSRYNVDELTKNYSAPAKPQNGAVDNVVSSETVESDAKEEPDKTEKVALNNETKEDISLTTKEF